MSKTPTTFDELLALWDSPKALSVDLNVPYINAQAMKRRKSVGVDHWPRLIELAAERGVRLTADDLLRMRAEVRPSAPPKQEMAS